MHSHTLLLDALHDQHLPEHEVCLAGSGLRLIFVCLRVVLT